MAAEKLEHLDGQYALALQHRNYYQAARFAIRGIRRYGPNGMWLMRLQGSLARRRKTCPD